MVVTVVIFFLNAWNALVSLLHQHIKAFHDRSRRHLVYQFNHDSAFLTLFHVNTWHLERIYLNLKLLLLFNVRNETFAPSMFIEARQRS